MKNVLHASSNVPRNVRILDALRNVEKFAISALKSVKLDVNIVNVPKHVLKFAIGNHAKSFVKINCHVDIHASVSAERLVRNNAEFKNVKTLIYQPLTFSLEWKMILKLDL